MEEMKIETKSFGSSEAVTITCDIAGDLMPLVADGVASEDSERALALHLEGCEDCRNNYEHMRAVQPAKPVSPTDDKKIIAFLRRRNALFGTLLLLFGAFAGVLFLDTQLVFQNFLLMPIIGALAYVCFKEKAALMAGVVFVMSVFVGPLAQWLRGDLSQRFWESMHGYFFYGVILAVLELIGIAIAALLTYAFRREKK